MPLYMLLSSGVLEVDPIHYRNLVSTYVNLRRITDFTRARNKEAGLKREGIERLGYRRRFMRASRMGELAGIIESAHGNEWSEIGP